MNNSEYPSFDPYRNLRAGEYEASESQLYHDLQLRVEHEEAWSCLNRDRDRTLEFAEFYFNRPDLQGWVRVLCAELVVGSAIDLIEPEPVDELEPASDDVAKELMGRILADPYTKYFMDSAVRPEMRAAGYYRRLASLYDKVIAARQMP